MCDVGSWDQVRRFFFFFQAEDGIRDLTVTGVQTCALPISFQQIAERYRAREDAADYLARKIREGGAGEWGRAIMPRHPHLDTAQSLQMAAWRSEERRVGKECRSRWSPYH